MITPCDLIACRDLAELHGSWRNDDDDDDDDEAFPACASGSSSSSARARTLAAAELLQPCARRPSGKLTSAL